MRRLGDGLHLWLNPCLTWNMRSADHGADRYLVPANLSNGAASFAALGFHTSYFRFRVKSLNHFGCPLGSLSVRSLMNASSRHHHRILIYSPPPLEAIDCCLKWDTVPVVIFYFFH